MLPDGFFLLSSRTIKPVSCIAVIENRHEEKNCFSIYYVHLPRSELPLAEGVCQNYLDCASISKKVGIFFCQIIEVKLFKRTFKTFFFLYDLLEFVNLAVQISVFIWHIYTAIN